jgi:hypothetical protein
MLTIMYSSLPGPTTPGTCEGGQTCFTVLIPLQCGLQHVVKRVVMMRKGDCMKSTAGQGMTEYLLVLFVLVLALGGGAYLLWRNPAWTSNALLVALAAALVAGISWAVKKTIEIINIRAQLFVYELLSHHLPSGLTRAEVTDKLRKAKVSFRLIPGLAIDAIAQLVANESIVAKQGRFLVRDTQNDMATRTPPIRRR